MDYVGSAQFWYKHHQKNGGYTKKQTSKKKHCFFFSAAEYRTEDLNLSTVSAQIILCSTLFQSTTVLGKKLFLKITVLVVSTAQQPVFFLADWCMLFVVLF